MKKFVKTAISAMVCLALMLSAFVMGASAASGNLSIGVSGTLNPGKNITVSITVSAPSGISHFGVFQANVDYDTSYLKLVSTSEGVTNAAGVIPICNIGGTAGTKSLTTNITFTVLKAGETTISVRDIITDEFNVASSSRKISIKNPTKSSDNTLKKLTIGAGTLTPAFSPNVTEYKVTVPYNVDYFNIDGIKNHSGASVSYSSGDKGPNIKVGTTVRTVTVTAENGSIKKYNITVTRLAQDATSSATSSNTSSVTSSNTSSVPEINPLDVIVNGSEMKVSEDLTKVEKPAGLELGEYEYNGVNIPSFSNKAGTIIALYLIGEGNSGLYLYKPETDTFEPLCILNSSAQFIIIPVNPIAESDISFDTVNTFNLTTITVNGNEVAAYRYKDEKLSDFAVVYAQNTSGEMGYYTYDISEGTLQRYVAQGNNISVDTKNPEAIIYDIDTIVVLACGALCVIAIIAIIIVWAVRRRRAIAEENMAYNNGISEDEKLFDWENETVGGDDFNAVTPELKDAPIDIEAFFDKQENAINTAEDTEIPDITEEKDQ